jgi:BirA family transcriptional regulator, biotin operon repressor / biotin---[acetyl-CoA-carboxylase] ligase
MLGPGLDPNMEQFLYESGRVYRYLASTTSSQDEARAMAQEGAPEGSLVVAEGQTAGRGRQGRSWQSAAGDSLTFSLVLRPILPVTQLPLIAFAAGVALREACGVGGLKWPNDLLAPNKAKLAGILLEAGGGVCILGIGLNIKAASEGGEPLDNWSSLGRTEVLEAFLSKFEHHYTAVSYKPQYVLNLWRQYSYTLGQEVTLKNPPLRGKAIGIAEDGSLLVESSGIHVVSAGDVELVGLLGGEKL